MGSGGGFGFDSAQNVLLGHRAFSKAGIIAGLLLVFIPCVGEYVIPQLLGGADTLMIGRVLAGEYFQNNDWPLASALAISIIVLVVVPMMILNKYQEEAGEVK